MCLAIWGLDDAHFQKINQKMDKTVRWWKLSWVRNLASLSSLFGAALPAAPLGSPLPHPPLLGEIKCTCLFTKCTDKTSPYNMMPLYKNIVHKKVKTCWNGHRHGYPGNDKCGGRGLVLLQLQTEVSDCIAPPCGDILYYNRKNHFFKNKSQFHWL